MSALSSKSARQRGSGPASPPSLSPCWRFGARHGLPALRGQEWLLTNGLGGFAMGSAAGIPTRRYHALLIGATAPPVGRIAALNAAVEQIEVAGRVHEFASFEFNSRADPVVHPDGVASLVSFECDESARWSYSVPNIEFSRELVLFAGSNAACLRYRVHRSGDARACSVALRVRPLVSLRDFHGLIRRSWADNFTIGEGHRGIAITRDGRELHIRASGSSAAFIRDAQWWYDFFYREDADRGQDCVEDLFSPGSFECRLAPGTVETTLELFIELGDPIASPARTAAMELEQRRESGAKLGRAAKPPGASPASAAAIGLLARASDAFIVSRRDAQGALSGVSTIAGYPWFSDWGRDTFISLEGLLLTTGRFDEARRELESFAAAQRNGIIPNVFNDQSGEPEFNTVDASLWFIHAACRWLACTGDRAAFESGMFEACLNVVHHYRRGTDFNIAMDPIDKLITAGTNATQLTWMDARRDGVTFTPRHGKAVEINALWFNALRSLAAAIGPGRGTITADLNDLAASVGRSFAAKFWNARQRCLFDCLTPGDSAGWTPDESIRPNQIFAVSLPNSPLSPDQQRAVVECVRTRLRTPMGVRTLDPADARYRGRYGGSLFERDGAYHQGTAWPWLLGPLAEAVARVGVFSPEARADAASILQPLLASLVGGDHDPQRGRCAGQVAEVYDGDDDPITPQRAGGCPAQAWSIAEPLRVLKLISA